MKSLLSLIAGVLLMVSCVDPKESKTSDSVADVETVSETQTETDESVKTEPMLLVKNHRDISDEAIQEMQQGAVTILAHRWKESNKKSWQILDVGVWEYEYIFSGKEMTKPGEFAGWWIDFKDDLTYEYGVYDDQRGLGRYHYDSNSGLLLLLDNNTAIKPQEFKAQLVNDVLVVVGTEVYRDNNYQAKLKKLTDRPTK